MKFSNLVNESLKSKGKISLSVLLEEKEEDKKPDSSDSSDPFDADFGDEEEGGEEDPLASLGGEEGGEEDPLASLGGEEGGESEEEEEDPSKEAIDALTSLEQNDREIDKINNQRSKIANKYKVDALSLESYSKSKISSFILFEEKEGSENDKASEIENVLQNYEEKLKDLEDKSYHAKARAPLGAEINIEDEAEEAFRRIKQFDNFYKKSEIIFDDFVEKIANTADVSKAEDLIKQFKDELNAKLDPEDRIGIQVKPTKYNAAVGASSAGKS
jgi:hypothetical protein